MCPLLSTLHVIFTHSRTWQLHGFEPRHAHVARAQEENPAYPPARVCQQERQTGVPASCCAGHGTNVIAGIGLGLESTALPTLVLSAALIASYWLGNTSGARTCAHRPPACRLHPPLLSLFYDI